MTRETKIGLLVGLAFVIMTGILLSNYLSSTNEPGAAPLKVAVDTLRSGLGEPGNDDVAPVLRAPAAITPTQPLMVNKELTAAQDRAAQPPVSFVSQRTTPHGSAITPNVLDGPGMTMAEQLRQEAQKQGEPVEPVDPRKGPALGTVVNIPAPHVDPQSPVKNAARTYEAQPGDSLGLIAQKAYGSGCKANRDAIVTANPGLAQNRDLVVAGRTYIIPTLASATVVNSPTPTDPRPSTPAAEKTILYVVQPHDTLWSIATDQVGTSSAVAAIEDLNKIVLNGSDHVRPNMKLKLPAKKTNE